MAKSNSITFRGARFTQSGLTVVNAPEAPPYCRINIRCDLSKNVLNEMGWDTGHGIKAGSLEGQLNGIAMIMTPASAALKNRELQLEVSTIDKFKLVPVKTEGEITGYDLTFQIRTRGLEIPSMVYGFIEAVGMEKSALKIQYTREPKQTDLPMDESAPAATE
jgi:hypothetical protein